LIPGLLKGFTRIDTIYVASGRDGVAFSQEHLRVVRKPELSYHSSEYTIIEALHFKRAAVPFATCPFSQNPLQSIRLLESVPTHQIVLFFLSTPSSGDSDL